MSIPFDSSLPILFELQQYQEVHFDELSSTIGSMLDLLYKIIPSLPLHIQYQPHYHLQLTLQVHILQLAFTREFRDVWIWIEVTGPLTGISVIRHVARLDKVDGRLRVSVVVYQYPSLVRHRTRVPLREIFFVFFVCP